MLRPKSKRSVSNEDSKADDPRVKVAKETLVYELFGEDDDLQETLPPIGKIVALLWLFRDDMEVTEYVASLVESHIMRKPSLVASMENYLPQLLQLALQFNPLDGDESNDRDSEAEHLNLLERLMLLMAQLSTGFAVQYHWTLKSFLQEHQPENLSAVASLDPHGAQYQQYISQYARCMSFATNLEQCMGGQKRKTKPILEILSTRGGKVTTEEKTNLPQSKVEKETNQTFYHDIVEIANGNASFIKAIPTNQSTTGESATSSQEQESAVHSLPLPKKGCFGGVLLFKRQHRRTGRRKTWKQRYFAIEESLLNCYSRERKLLRSLSLDGAVIFKGPNEKHSHCFVVANDETMFLLRASSEKEKSEWKRQLRAVINANQLPDDATETQKERHERYHKTKWFGRTITDTTQDLNYLPSAERAKYLYEHLFELDIPNGVCWPWVQEALDGTCSEKRVFVVLPHFSQLVSAVPKARKDNIASRFQLSCLLNGDKSESNEQAEDSGHAYDRFIREGHQKHLLLYSDFPESLMDIVRTVRKRAAANSRDGKHVDGATTTSGDSTDGLSTDSSGGPNSHQQGEPQSSMGSCDSVSTSADTVLSGNQAKPISSLSLDSLKKPISALSLFASPDDKHSLPVSPRKCVRFNLPEKDLDDHSVQTGAATCISNRSGGSDLSSVAPIPEDEEPQIAIELEYVDENGEFVSNIEDVPGGDEESVSDTEDVTEDYDDETFDESVTETEDAYDEGQEPGLAAALVGAIATALGTTTEDAEEHDSESQKEKQINSPKDQEESGEAIPRPEDESWSEKLQSELKKLVGDQEDDDSCCDGVAFEAALIEYDDNVVFEEQQAFDWENMDADEVKFRILPQTTEGLVTLCTKPYRREEMVAAQLANHIQSILEEGKLEIWLKPPRVRRLNKDTSIMETPRKALSLEEIKRESGNLAKHFVQKFGAPDSTSFQEAQGRFTQSLAGLSLLTYILGLKNRQDTNILLDAEGNIFMRDFSWALGIGFNTAMEMAPFKLTREYVAILGGPKSKKYQEFQRLFVEGLKLVREDASTLLGLLQYDGADDDWLHQVNGSKRQRDNMMRFLQQKLFLQQDNANDKNSALEKRMSSLVDQSRGYFMTSKMTSLSKFSASAIEV